MHALGLQQRAHRLALSGDLAAFICAAGGEQLCVEIFEIARFRQRDPVVAPKVAGLAFDAAFGQSCRIQTVSLMRSDVGFG
jgi:hypothetical protein